MTLSEDYQGIVIDECVNLRVLGNALVEETVSFIAKDAPALPDKRIIEYASAHQMIILTEDHDFGTLIFRDHVTPPPGIVLLTLQNVTTEQARQRFAQVWPSLRKSVAGRFRLVTADAIRQRAMPNG